MELLSSTKTNTTAAVWCAYRDLVLIQSSAADASVARLPMLAKLWSAKGLCAGAWQQDGRILATARDANSALVTLIEAESGKLVCPVICPPPFPPGIRLAKVVHLAWFCRDMYNLWRKQKTIKNRTNIVDALPPIPGIAPHKSAANPFSNSNSADAFDRLVRRIDVSDILVIIREDLTVNFNLWGLFHLGSIKILAHELNGGDEIESSTVTIATIATPILHTHMSSIAIIAHHSLKLANAVLHDLARAADTLMKEYAGFCEISARQTSSLGESFMAQDEQATPLESLEALLATGYASPALESYLGGNMLGEQGLKKWKRSLQTGYTNIELLVVGTVIPVLERLIVWLSDLLGFSRTKGQYEDIGLDEEAILRCIDTVMRFAQDLEIVRKVLCADLVDFNEFFAWLSFAIESVSTLDKLGDEISTPTFDAKKVMSAIEKLYKTDARVRVFFAKSRATSRSAANIAGTLKSHFDEIFGAIWMTAETQFELRRVHAIATVSRRQQLQSDGWKSRVSMIEIEEHLHLAVAIPEAPYNLIQEDLIKWDVTAISFLGDTLIAVLYSSEQNKSVLVHLETSGYLEDTYADDEDYESDENAQISGAQVRSLHEVNNTFPKSVQVNPSQDLFSVICTDGSMMVFGVSSMP
ncbi:anaphase promoting complex subunit 4 [Physocladia obscura]|uniref:Anaphase-promoting complex subunit 4 n=1 Tax=Physocladia obscura TaxID=109957 RepID=A0AAD5T9Z6_9FUNG|nr:anaphase promoting complex subunit 4 [Physocladia obscura]